MSDQDGDDPETGAGGGGNTPATDPNNNSDVGNDPTTPHMGDRSDGGEFESPNTEGDTGRARVPSERVQKMTFLNRIRLNALNLQLKRFRHRKCRRHLQVQVSCKTMLKV